MLWTVDSDIYRNHQEIEGIIEIIKYTFLKIYRNLCEAIAGGLDQVFIEGGHTVSVVETLLASNKKWGSRDRNFIANYLYNAVRYYRLYCYAIDIDVITSRTDSWKLTGACLINNGYDLPEWPEWEGLDAAAVKEKIASAQTIRKIKESVPDWLDERCSAELGDAWDKELTALNQPAPLCIRVNTLKATKDSVIDFLNAEDIEFSLPEDAPDGIVIHSKKNLRQTYPYKSGWFEVQDISSQQVAMVLDPKPGMKVIDACAGAGGKTLHISALMQGRGEIIAIDIYPDKIKELENRARRNGVENINALPYTKGLVKIYEGEADRLLLDVPCSATGVIRRNPDTKWKLTPEALDEVITLQQELLVKYSPMVKQGGIMVYATCSILPSENENQIDVFIKGNPDFEKVEERKISPAESGFDGFYICKLLKTR
jgi:16S rRNA (cytosine967-C5)-methyltransferase